MIYYNQLKKKVVIVMIEVEIKNQFKELEEMVEQFKSLKLFKKREFIKILSHINDLSFTLDKFIDEQFKKGNISLLKQVTLSQITLESFTKITVVKPRYYLKNVNYVIPTVWANITYVMSGTKQTIQMFD